MSQPQRVPFHRRLRFNMIMTVLLLVTLVSGTSILISYHVTGLKIERDMQNDFYSAEEVVETYVGLHSRHLRTAAEAAAEDLTWVAKNGSMQPDAAAELLGRLMRKSEVDMLCFIDVSGRITAAPEQAGPAAAALTAQPLIREKMAEKAAFSLFLPSPASPGSDQKKFFLVSFVPARLQQDGEPHGFIMSGYVADSAFLSRIPVHPNMGLSLVSDNVVLATTLPPESYGQDPVSYTAYSSSSALLPGALDFPYESSFFREKMSIKTKYIPSMKVSTPNFLIISHPSKLILATDKEFGQHFLIIFFVGLCSSLILVFFITGAVLNPISDLQRLVRKISAGDLSDRIDTSVSNEFTPLIMQFNSMLDLIQRKDEDLLELVEAKTKELRQQNVFIDNLLRSSQVMAIAATDMELRVTYFNPVAERLFGYSGHEVIGKKVTRFQAHIKDQEEVFNQLVAAALEKGSHTFTIGTADFQTYDILDSSDGGGRNGRYQRVIEVYLSPIRANQGEEATGLMLMAQDITEARQMDERLRAALAELQVIIDNTMLGLILVQDDRIVRVNTTFESMFGRRFEEIREMSWSAFYLAAFAGREAECWDGSGRMFFMNRKSGGDAQPFWSKVRRVAIDDEQQAGLRRELFLFEDMSVQNEMFEKIQRLSQAVEQSSNSVVITDTDGTIEYVNRTFVKLTGHRAEEVIGSNLAMLSPDESGALLYGQIWAAARSGMEWTGELVNRKKNGDLYEENVVVSPIRNEQNEITHFVLTKENITDLKRARQQADAANKAKSEFLANMSHEIRTPMNSIIGMTELLLDTPLQPEQRGYLENVNSSASVLLSLINDILDFSKIEAGRLELDSHPFSIPHLAEEIIATLKILAEQKDIDLRLTVTGGHEDCFPLGDSLRIRQVLLNLVGNAIKFTRKGYVALEIQLNRADLGRCAADFKIIDTGIGIAKEQQENIFANFTQADSSITRDYGGTGLGLAISNRLLQLMGSKIELESEPGKGSVFSFSLLLENGGAKAAADMRREEEEICPVGRRLDILLVEDNPANQQLAVILLVKQGHQVTVAGNGAEAIDRLSRHRYDMIFMDMQMPVMDGLTATRHIRRLEQGLPTDLPGSLAGQAGLLRERLAGGHLHIIAVTANALQEDRQQCLEAGMDEYLSKPYKKNSMLRVLQRFDQHPAVHDPAATRPEAPAQAQDAPQLAAVARAAVKEHLIRQFELDRNDAEEVLAAYADSLKDNLGRLRQCLADGQGAEGGRQAHALKGGLLNLGLEEQAKTALALEKELPQQIEERHLRMIEQLAEALKELTA